MWACLCYGLVFCGSGFECLGLDFRPGVWVSCGCIFRWLFERFPGLVVVGVAVRRFR